MKKIIQWAIFVLILSGKVSLGLAQVMEIQPLSSVLQKIKGEGYVAVTRVELLDGEYKVNAIDNEGETVEMGINSHNGKIISTKKIDSHISMFEVVEKVEAIGYAGITFIEMQNRHYVVTAIGPGGKKSQLYVDGNNCRITRVP